MCVSFPPLLLLLSLGYRTLLWVFGHVPGSLIEAAKRERERERGVEKALTTAVAVVQNRIGRVAHTQTHTHTLVYFIMMDGYDCTRCACVCVYEFQLKSRCAAPARI